MAKVPDIPALEGVIYYVQNNDLYGIHRSRLAICTKSRKAKLLYNWRTGRYLSCLAWSMALEPSLYTIYTL
jgi:hypothetical protein